MTAGIARLRKLLGEATPGPWVEDDGNVFSAPISNANYRERSAARREGRPQPDLGYDGEVAKCSQSLPNFDADAVLIAAARNALPLLLALVEAADLMRSGGNGIDSEQADNYDAARAELEKEMSK